MYSRNLRTLAPFERAKPFHALTEQNTSQEKPWLNCSGCHNLLERDGGFYRTGCGEMSCSSCVSPSGICSFCRMPTSSCYREWVSLDSELGKVFTRDCTSLLIQQAETSQRQFSQMNKLISYLFERTQVYESELQAARNRIEDLENERAEQKMIDKPDTSLSYSRSTNSRGGAVYPMRNSIRDSSQLSGAYKVTELPSPYRLQERAMTPLNPQRDFKRWSYRPRSGVNSPYPKNSYPQTSQSSIEPFLRSASSYVGQKERPVTRQAQTPHQPPNTPAHKPQALQTEADKVSIIPTHMHLPANHSSLPDTQQASPSPFGPNKHSLIGSLKKKLPAITLPSEHPQASLLRQRSSNAKSLVEINRSNLDFQRDCLWSGRIERSKSEQQESDGKAEVQQENE